MAPLTKTLTPCLRAILQSPASLRPALATSSPQLLRRTYHSYETAPPPPYPETESRILSHALTHVPKSGFSQTSLRQGAQDAGYLEASTNLFPRGEFELVLYHLRTQRLGLSERIGFGQQEQKEAGVGVGRKVRALVMERLRGNRDACVQERWQEAIALMSLAGNIPPSLHELFLLSDEIWFLAGDISVDASWYTKRATLASIYAAVEVYSTTDESTDFKDTEEFLNRRLAEASVVGGAYKNVLEWVGHQGMATVNLARSWGMRV